MPSITTIVNVSNQYPGFMDLETITVAVTTANGVAVNEGVVGIQVDGQTVYALVKNGMATATVVTGLFDFSLWMDLLFAHALTADYSDYTGTYGTSSAGTTAPPILLDFFLYEIAQQMASPLTQLQDE